MNRSPSSGAAEPGRGDNGVTLLPKDYRLQLPPLPTGETAKLSVVLHADLEGRPYRTEDFRQPLHQVGILSGVAGLGAYQMSHVWLLKLRTPEAKAKLLEAGSLQVKGKLCHVVDPSRRELRIKLHWVTFDVPVDSVRRAFEPYGSVKDITRETWKVEGFVDVESTTLAVRMTLNEGIPLESLSHQLRIGGGTVLVVVPGRAPICLRCRRTGHIRRDCRAPRCSQCRAFGHETRDCVKTYARVTGSNTDTVASELVMDEDEAEMAAAPSTSLAQQPRNEAGAASSIPGPVAPELPHGAPREKVDTEASQDVVPEQATETSSTPAGPAQREDTVVSKDDDQNNDMDVVTGCAKRVLEDPPSGRGEAQLRRLEREWCGKVGRFKTQSVPLTRNKEQKQ
ncbi:uncharacterized protein ISCGN_021176 [Ixodes scapularis]